MTTNANEVINTPDNDSLDDFASEFYQTASSEKPAEAGDEGADENNSFEDENALATESTDETVDSDPAESGEEDDPSDPEEETPKPKKQTAQDRIREINAKYREEERLRAQEREYYERRIKELEVQTPKSQDEPATPKAPIIEVGGPTPDDVNEDGSDKYPLGEFDPQLAADRAKFHVEQAWAQKEAEAAARREAEAKAAEDARIQNEWTAKLDAAETGEIPMIRESAKVVINEFQSLPVEYGNYLANTIMALDKGPEVLAYLADNLDEARRIVASGHIAATIALGEIQSQFKGVGNKPNPVRVTRAPEPPKNLTRGNSGRFETSDDTDDLDAFAAKMYKR